VTPTPKKAEEVLIVYWIRTFRNTRTGKTFEVASNEQYLSPLRRRVVKECGGEPDWENESVYEHQGLDVKWPGEHPNIEIIPLS
jgi:hypothetical protein